MSLKNNEEAENQTVKQDNLIYHIESNLGQIDGGWSESLDHAQIPFQIVWIKNCPVHQATTFMQTDFLHWLLYW